VQRIWHVVSKTNAEALNDVPIRDLPRLVELLARVHANLVVVETLQQRNATCFMKV
jgi:hypothetical protein